MLVSTDQADARETDAFAEVFGDQHPVGPGGYHLEIGVVANHRIDDAGQLVGEIDAVGRWVGKGPVGCPFVTHGDDGD